MNNKPSLHLYVSPKTTLADVECVNLAQMGFGYEAIAQRTGLSQAQVGYRLKIAGVRPSDYRKGQTVLAKQVMNLAHENSREYFDTMTSRILKYLKDSSPVTPEKEQAA